MLGSLLPQPRVAVARNWRPWGFGIGPRLILLLLLGLLWLVPAWWDRRALYGLLAWDVLLLGIFVLDLRRLQRARPEASRIWTAAPALSTPAEVRIELRNLGEIFYTAAQDDVPAALRRAPPHWKCRPIAGEKREPATRLSPCSEAMCISAHCSCAARAAGVLRNAGCALTWRTLFAFIPTWVKPSGTCFTCCAAARLKWSGA